MKTVKKLANVPACQAVLALWVVGVGCMAHPSASAERGDTAAKPPVAEPLGPDDVRIVIERRTPELQSCFTRNVDVSVPEIKVTAEWVIGVDGTTSRVGIQEATASVPAFEACLTAAILSWRFPVPSQEIEIRFPFVFRRNS